MVTLNKSESEKFLKRMLYTERRPITKKEKKLAQEIMKMKTITLFEGALEDSSYVAQNGMITFKGNTTYSYKKLEEILNQCKKLKKNDILTTLYIDMSTRFKPKKNMSAMALTVKQHAHVKNMKAKRKKKNV
jgi:hypothetical protein